MTSHPSPPLEFRQVYKTRSAAFREFIKPQGLPISERTFYNAVDRLNMLQPDKSVKLADLVAYVQRELTPAGGGESPDDIERATETAKYKFRLLKAEVDSKEKANRKEDARWILREDADIQRAALTGLTYDTIKHHFHIEERRILHAVGADHGRASELGAAMEEVLDMAFNEIAAHREVEVEFLE